MARARRKQCTVATAAACLPLLLLFHLARAASEECRLETHTTLDPASLPPLWRLPFSGARVSLAVLQRTGDPIVAVDDDETEAAAASATTTALGTLPPGLHLFLDLPAASLDPATAAHLEEQLLPAVLKPHSAALSAVRPLLRQFAEVAPAVAADLRRVLMVGVDADGGCSHTTHQERRQLLWYYANDPGLALPIAPIAPIFLMADAASSSVRGYHLTLSWPSTAPRLTTYTCPSAAPTSSACRGCAQLRLTPAEPPGAHVQE